MASGPITSWQIDGETATDFIFLGSKIIADFAANADGDCSHKIKRRLLFGIKVITNLDSILKNRIITLPTNVCLVKAMVFPVVMYGCESWTIKKACCCCCCCCVASVVSDSVRSHGLQPTRLLRPWDSPGKNTGVGCHFLLQCMKVKSENEVAQSCTTPSDPMDCSPPGSSIHGICQARVLEWGAIAFSVSDYYCPPKGKYPQEQG